MSEAIRILREKYFSHVSDEDWATIAPTISLTPLEELAIQDKFVEAVNNVAEILSKSKADWSCVTRALKILENHKPTVGPYTKRLWDVMMGRHNV